MPRAVGAVRPSQPDLLPVPLDPWGPAVSVAPCLHWAQQCHNGPLVQ